MPLEDYRMLISQAAELGVFQVALGGGNPNQHPDFVEILRLTRESGIVPNYTTNGCGLNDAILDATREYCGAMAVSAYPPYDYLPEVLRSIQCYGLKTNIHYILSSRSIYNAIDWLRESPEWLHAINAIVFLNYKPIGPVVDNDKLLSRSDQLQAFFDLVGQGGFPFKVGFDSCSVSGLLKYTQFSSRYFDFCEGARFSMFVSEEMKAYPCSFMVESGEGVKVREGNLLDIWQNAPVFSQFRKKLQHPVCDECSLIDTCHGGCPIFPDINLCLVDED